MRLSIALVVPVAGSLLPLVVLATAPAALRAVEHEPAPPPVPHFVPVVVAPVVAPPAAAACELAGVWIARTYRTEMADWHEYTLAVTCSDSTLSGTLDLRSWSGRSAATPACRNGTPAENRVHILATGTTTAHHVRIDARAEVSREASACTSAKGYSLDHFVGTFDPATDTLDVLNNDDAGYAHDRPYQFHRVRR